MSGDLHDWSHPDEVEDVLHCIRACVPQSSSSSSHVVVPSSIRVWFEELHLFSTATASTGEAADLNTLEVKTREIILFILGITHEGTPCSNQRLQQVHNVRLLHRDHTDVAFPRLIELFHIALRAHQYETKQIIIRDTTSTLDVPIVSTDTNELTPIHSTPSLSTASRQNPYDLFTRTSRYWLSLTLLRRSLTILHVYIQTLRKDETFLRTLVHDAYLLNTLFECMSVLPTSDLSTGADSAVAADDDGDDEFIVEYSENKLGSSQRIETTSSPKCKSTSSYEDPSTTIESLHWKSLASKSFSSGLRWSQISSVSMMPLGKILPLLSLILELIVPPSSPLPSSSSSPPSTSSSETGVGSLYGFQVQEVCSILSIAHGPILYTPELNTSQTTTRSTSEDAVAQSSSCENRLTKYSQNGVPTDSFPFIATEVLSNTIKTQLSTLASHVIPPPATPSSPVALNTSALYGLLLPDLKKYITSLSQLLLVLTPGFDLHQATADDDANTDTMQNESDQRTFIDLRMQILGSTSLSPDTDATVPAYTFALRQTREVLLSSTLSILIALHRLSSYVDRLVESNNDVPLRYWCQLIHETDLPLIFVKLLNHDWNATLAKRCEGIEENQVERQDWIERATKTKTKNTIELALVSDLSKRHLTCIVDIVRLLRLTFDLSLGESDLLSLSRLYRSGVSHFLVRIWEKYLSDSTSNNRFDRIRQDLASAWRSFQPFHNTNNNNNPTTNTNLTIQSIRTYLDTHPTRDMFETVTNILYGPNSPLRDLSSLCDATEATSELYSIATQELLDEIGIAERKRFPYGECAPLATSVVGGTGPSPTPTNIPATPIEPPVRGMGQAILFQPTPTLPTLLQDTFIRLSLGLTPRDHVGEALERARTISKVWPEEMDPARLADERQQKLDRILSMHARCGDHMRTLSAYDLYATSVGPPIVNRKVVTLIQYLILADARRRWSSEAYFLSVYSVELSLLTPSLAHRGPAGPMLRARRNAERRRLMCESNIAKYIACGRSWLNGIAANGNKKDGTMPPFVGGSSPSIMSLGQFVSHPFPLVCVSDGVSSNFRSTLVDTLMRPIHTPNGYDISIRDKASIIIDGRVQLDEQQLRDGYEELIANGEFD